MLIGVKEAATLLGVSEKSIYRWTNQDSIPFYRVQGQYRFRSSELLAWATDRGAGSPRRTEAEGEEPVPLPSLSEALESGGVHYRVSGGDKASALRSALQVIRLPDGTDAEQLLASFLERESLCSTGLGRGVAVPHSRTPVLRLVRRSVVAVCFLETPVDFDAVDGDPVTTLLIPLATSVRVHLHLISRLAFALRDEELLELLQRQASREEIFEYVKTVESEMPS